LPFQVTCMSIRRFVLALLVFAAPSLAFAQEGRVIGDSLGVGVDWAAKLPSTAKNSVAIYSGAVLDQLRQAKKGETVFMSLGTNDAVGGALDVKARVQAIVATADQLGVKLVWMGPPCVLKPWEVYSKRLDEILKAELAGTSVTYVSMQDAAFCDPSIHAPEGVHFSMAGYTRMWQKAATAAGFPVVVASASEPKAAAPGGRTTPAKKKRHHRRKHAVAEPATAVPPAPN
jgi:hypothetical protein